jgi:hypothetical protein
MIVDDFLIGSSICGLVLAIGYVRVVLLHLRRS